MKKHHTKKGFRNIHPVPKRNFRDFIRWQRESKGKKNHPVKLPLYHNDTQFLKSNRSKPTLTWIGHSAFLLQYGGMNILTDPMLGEYASPVRWAGPKRMNPPGLTVEELPDIDWVILSHDHYDHLDRDTILGIEKKQRDHPPHYFVPLGVKEWFKDEGIDRVTELDWWQSVQKDGWEFICVPAQHFSGWWLFSTNKTLWAGWILKHPDFSFYFVGDTGYNEDFKIIGEKFGPFALTAIPIGAYEPRWFMSPVHVDPEHAVQIHIDVRSRFSVAMHWGVFLLSDEKPDDPPKVLKKALDEKGISQGEFVSLQIGEMIDLNPVLRSIKTGDELNK